MNNQELRAQDELEKFFLDAKILQKRKARKYGESWQNGRPVGITDNMYWIIIRVQNMEKELVRLHFERSRISHNDEAAVDGISQMIYELHEKIEDDLLDLANFAGFRWVMNKDKRDLL